MKVEYIKYCFLGNKKEDYITGFKPINRNLAARMLFLLKLLFLEGKFRNEDDLPLDTAVTMQSAQPDLEDQQ